MPSAENIREPLVAVIDEGTKTIKFIVSIHFMFLRFTKFETKYRTRVFLYCVVEMDVINLNVSLYNKDR